jgi:hypothetical protein
MPGLSHLGELRVEQINEMGVVCGGYAGRERREIPGLARWM